MSAGPAREARLGPEAETAAKARARSGSVGETAPHPGAPGHARMLALQRSGGNRAVAGLMRSAGRGPIVGSGLIQRVLEEHPGTGTGGQSTVKSAGQKMLLRETDDGKIYFKSNLSTPTDWVLIEVKLAADGKTYERTGAQKTVKAQKKVPQTRAEWSAAAYVSGDGDRILYPRQAYPHVTIDVKTPAKEPGDKIEFETMHYSRSFDDPYRSGYQLEAGGWRPVKPPDKKDKAVECHDRVDEFLEAVGFATRVIRK